MAALIAFLKTLLIRTPQEILVTLLRLFLLILLIIPFLLAWLLEWLCEIFRGKNLYPEKTEAPCGRIPEAVIRRPDPCLYSQKLLQSQNLPVTWNNPDIWVAPASDPAAIEPDSYHLKDDTDYIASVRVHNASTDAAIGVRVRLNYRPWSFNSPDLTPVEVDGNGNEVVRFVNVPPMSSTPVIPGNPPLSPALAQFNWHTPKLDQGATKKHFCLQASLYHPLDTNLANNMGQENTNVYTSPNPGLARPGDVIDIVVQLFNNEREARQFMFVANAYKVEEKADFELELKTTRGFAKRRLSRRIANYLPTLHAKPVGGEEVKADGSRLSTTQKPDLQGVKTKYVGFDKIRDDILSRDSSLPPGMTITANKKPLEKGLRLAAGKQADVAFAIKIPTDATPGEIIPVNLMAIADNGTLAGGVTILFKIREGN